MTPWTAAHQAPCPSPTPRACSNSCPLSWWCHPGISSSVIPFSSCLQSFPASESFPMCQFFLSGGQSIGVSASASALPMNIQDWSPLGWTGLISLKSKGLSRVLSNTTVQKHQFFSPKLSLWSNSYIHTMGKTIALTRQTFVSKVMSLLSRLVIAFFPRSQHLLIACLQSPSTVILELKKIVFHYFPQFIVIHRVKGFGVVNKAEVGVFLELFWLFQRSNGCWQFDLWSLCLF